MDTEQRIARVHTIYQRAHDRGELDLNDVPAVVLDVPFDLVRHDLMMTQEAVSLVRIKSIVDEIFLPLVRNCEGLPRPMGASPESRHSPNI